MTDIMQGWRDQRFVIVDQVITGGHTTVVLSDFAFWSTHDDDLADWLVEHPGAEQKGMTIDFADDATLALFCLRWQ